MMDHFRVRRWQDIQRPMMRGLLWMEKCTMCPGKQLSSVCEWKEGSLTQAHAIIIII